MLKIASSEIAAPDLAPESGGAAETVPARLQAHAVADEAEWHRSPEPMSVPRAPVSICQRGAVCGPLRRSSPLRAATTCSSCGRSLRAPASIANQRSIPCH
jgi:hypothetical protein